jgi:hypothetical protein
MRFRTTITAGSGSTTGIEVPPEVVEALGQGRRPPVRVTVNGYTYRSSIAVLGGRFLVSLSAAHRAAAGVGAGDEVDVELEHDDAPREVDVPADLAAALAGEPEARRRFDGLAYSHRLRHVLAIEDAKTPETRRRRVEKAVAMLLQDPQR